MAPPGRWSVGEVVEAGSDVHDLRPGDRVIVSSVSACGRCPACRDTLRGQCRGGGGWILGNLINGTQAELVRVPFADHSTHRRPSALPLDDAVLLAEVLPTAYEVGVRNAEVGPEDTVVVVGGGPVGLACVVVARLCSPRRIIVVDLSSARLEAAARVGADAAEPPGTVIAELSEGTRCRRGHRGIRGTGGLRPEHPRRPRGRAHGQHRHARRARAPASRFPVAQEREVFSHGTTSGALKVVLRRQ